eukprot:1425375-Amphidinium_carterae.2
MTNLSVQAKVAFMRFPQTLQTGAVKIGVVALGCILGSAGLLQCCVHAVVERDGVSCTDCQGLTSIEHTVIRNAHLTS